MPSASSSSLFKDPNYYRSNDDTIFLVEDVLFKVCAYIFMFWPTALVDNLLHVQIRQDRLVEHESSRFRELLKDKNANGLGSEDHPYVLQDNMDEFRALCWILHA
jgi:hypothetical protein